MRTTLHIILGVLLWVVFIYYWYIVMKQPITDETRRALLVVGAASARGVWLDFAVMAAVFVVLVGLAARLYPGLAR